MSKQLEIFRRVNELAERHYKNQQSGHVEFLSDCHKALAKYFEEYFGGEFIFSALSFSKNNQLHYVDEAINNGYIFNKNSVANWNKLSELFTKYINEVSDNKLISLTKILLDEKNSSVRKDLFFTCCSDCKYDTAILGNGDEENIKVFEHVLGTFNEDKESYYNANRNKLDKFYEAYSSGSYEQNKNLYDRYIWDYHELSHTYKTANNKSDFLLHFIKPSIAELDYGLLLSLATNRKLIADELAFVNLILYRVVSQKVRENIKEESIADLIQTTYSLGHNLKNRLLESDALMESLITDIEKSSLDESEKKDIKRYASNVSSKVKSLSNTGKILDLIGRFMAEKKWQDKWLSNSDYSFNEKIKNGEFTRVSISGKYAKINIDSFPTTLKLKGWLGKDNKHRPADFVYEELFFELLVNTLTYGKAYVEGDKKYVDVNISMEGNKIVIVNTPDKKIDENDKFKSVKNVFIKPTVIGHGGLLYMYKFLTQTDIGDIDIFLDATNNQFKIILKLNGISHDE